MYILQKHFLQKHFLQKYFINFVKITTLLGGRENTCLCKIPLVWFQHVYIYLGVFYILSRLLNNIINIAIFY
jgi:hypothetical protein